jgi:hypothetical protein
MLPGRHNPPPVDVSSRPALTNPPPRATAPDGPLDSGGQERLRTAVPPRPTTRSQLSPGANGATDYSLPMPAQRSTPDVAQPGSRANWPVRNATDDLAAPASVSSSPAEGRVRPPWQDMPKEPPPLRLVEQLGNTPADVTVADEPPALRLVGSDDGGDRSPRHTALERDTIPPVPVPVSDEDDDDLLIFAAARSAWFTGHDDSADLDWTNPNDTGWRAAERAASPTFSTETPAGLPKRVPQANLVPGSPLRDERPLRIVRDAASIAAHTTGYFRGWRRGQEIGGYAIGGRPGRESAGGWDFSRDAPADEGRNSGYRTN